MRSIGTLAGLGAAFFLIALAGTAEANSFRGRTYTVKITNLTKQVLTPPVVASHRKSFRTFRVGGEASLPLYTMAETGAPTLLAEYLDGRPEVGDVSVGDGPIMPGQSMSIQIRGSHSAPSFSVFGMLASTNDAFFAVQGRRLTTWLTSSEAPVYDAGSEANNESCAYVPGPPCAGSEARMTDGAEGFIHRSGGLHGVGDLEPADLDWRGPAAIIEVYRNY